MKSTIIFVKIKKIMLNYSIVLLKFKMKSTLIIIKFQFLNNQSI